MSYSFNEQFRSLMEEYTDDDKYIAKDYDKVSFEMFVSDIRKNFYKDNTYLIDQANDILQKDTTIKKPISVEKVELTGSYKDGSPTEDSDIDVLVTYRGVEEPETIVNALAGKLHGRFGIYDVVPKRVNTIIADRNPSAYGRPSEAGSWYYKFDIYDNEGRRRQERIDISKSLLNKYKDAVYKMDDAKMFYLLKSVTGQS